MECGKEWLNENSERLKAQAFHQQTRWQSFTEQLANQVVSFGIAWCINIFLLPALGMPGGAGKAFGVTLLFVAISTVRGYCLRRVFNRLHHRKV